MLSWPHFRLPRSSLSHHYLGFISKNRLFFFLLKELIYFLCMSICLCACICTMSLVRPEEGMESPGTGAYMWLGYKLPFGSWELNLVLWKCSQLLLTCEPSLQPEHRLIEQGRRMASLTTLQGLDQLGLHSETPINRTKLRKKTQQVLIAFFKS